MTLSPPPPIVQKPVRSIDATPFRGHWLLGCVRELRGNYLDLYEAAWRAKGDYIRIRALPGYYVNMLAHPDAVEHILQKNSRNYRKPDLFNNPVRELFGDGLVVSEGDFWISQRKLIQPAFSRQHMTRFSAVISDGTQSLIRQWSQRDHSEPVDILPEMMRLTLGIASMALLSHDISDASDQLGKTFRAAFAHVSRRMNAMIKLPRWIPTPDNRDFNRVKEVLHTTVRKIVEQRRRETNRPDDMLSTFLAAQDDQTRIGMTDDQLVHEVLTMLTASHDTVGAALSWTWYLLAQHPQVQETLDDELKSHLGDRPPTAADLPELPFARAVFEEAMRLFPPAPAVMREAIADDEINGFRIKKRSLVVACQYLIHRHPDFWDEPQRFNPERFISPDAIAKRPKLACFPFGAGPRVCVGQTFAMIEGPLILATIAQRFQMKLVPGQTILPDTTFTLRPKPGVNVFLQPR